MTAGGAGAALRSGRGVCRVIDGIIVREIKLEFNSLLKNLRIFTPPRATALHCLSGRAQQWQLKRQCEEWRQQQHQQPGNDYWSMLMVCDRLFINGDRGGGCEGGGTNKNEFVVADSLLVALIKRGAGWECV